LVRNAVVAVAAALLAAGCAAVVTSNVPPSYRPGDNGLLVVSLSASGYSPGTLWLQVAPAAALQQTAALIPVNDPAHGLDWIRSDAVPPGAVGRLAVLELAPGAYQLRDWIIRIGSRQTLTSVRPLGYRFAIEPGKATYLGSLHVDLKSTVTVSAVAFEVQLEDRRGRDLPLLHARYPGVRAEQVVVALPASEPMARVPEEAQGLTRIEDLRDLLPKP
jgi:hypothetical protein